MERMQRVEMEKMVKKMSKPVGPGKQPAMSETQIQQFREQIEKSLIEMREKLAELKDGSGPARVPEPLVSVTAADFSRDGQWLFCGTLGGIHAYMWDRVPREAGADLLEPTWVSEGLGRDQDGRSKDMVLAIAEEKDAPAVIFGGSEGRLHRLDYATGQVRELVRLPGGCWITEIAMSVDGTTLGVQMGMLGFTEAERQRGERKSAWEVYSSERLRERG